MKVSDPRIEAINFLRSMMNYANEGHVVGETDYAKSFEVCGGACGSLKRNKKYQYVKGELCISHKAINEEFKNDISVIKESLQKYRVAIPRRMASELAITESEKAKMQADDFFAKNPRVMAALNELMAAIKEAGEKQS